MTIGDETRTTTIKDNGTWGITIPGNDLPSDGTHIAQVVVTTPEGVNIPLTGPTFILDMTPPEVEVTAGVQSTGDVENLVEYQDGVTISGEGEAGATIEVKIDGHVQTTTIATDGTWSVTFTQSQVAAGEYTIPVKVTATDPLGNQTVLNETLVVDTIPHPLSINDVTSDNVVNLNESNGALAVTGTSTAGAVVTVTMAGVTQTATVGSNGKWTMNFAAGTLEGGDYDTTLTATTVDAAGNTSSATHTVHVDTLMNVSINANQVGGDNIISGAEERAGVALTGLAEAGATVEVTFEGTTRTVTANSNGKWTAAFSSSEIREGTYDSVVSVTAKDAAGNTATDTHTIQVDTEVRDFARTSMSAGADNVVNKVEADAGLTVSGTVEPGSTVVIKFGSGTTHNATVDASGVWTVKIPSGEIPRGESNVTMTATATDHVGNTATLTEVVKVDTVVRNLGLTGQIGGDSMINANEAAQGVVIKGTVEAGSTVVIALDNGSSHTVTANSNGLWTTTFAAGELPSGDGVSMTATVTATDRAGNTDSFMKTVLVDTVAPDSPDVVSFSRDANGLRAIGTETTGDTYSFNRVDASGAQSSLNAVQTDDTVFNESNFRFQSTVPDGSYLVINNSDVAGNTSSTLLIVDNTSAPNVDLGRSGLSQFDFKAIDLTFAPDANLRISEAQLKSLTGPENSLTIKGDSDDTVTMTGAHDTGNTTMIGGEQYEIYTLGNDGATILLDDDITPVI